jgi:transcriptional regulator with GAF, ATPase, and Fis domain
LLSGTGWHNDVRDSSVLVRVWFWVGCMAVSDERLGDDSSPAQREDAGVPPASDASRAVAAELIDVQGLAVESLVQLLTLVRADLADVFNKEEATPEQLLDRVVQVATRLVPGTEDAGVAVFVEGQLRTVAAVGDLAVALDDIQRVVGVGPTVDVVGDALTLRVTDLSTEPRWGEFGARAVWEGARALLACPLPLPLRQAGVLSLYSGRPAAFDAAAELVVPVFAARAAIALAHAEKVAQLERAMQNRQMIGQAVGILMERHRLSAKQAFDTLVKASQEAHMKLREIALRVTESGEEPGQAARQDH